MREGGKGEEGGDEALRMWRKREGEKWMKHG